MENSDLTEAMQEMIAEMAALGDELTVLKQRANGIIPLQPPEQPAKAVVSINRRKVLRRLAGVIMAGLGVAVTLPENAQARLIIDPVAPNSSRIIGAIIVPPGTPTPGGNPTGKYGLVVTDGSDTTFNLTKLPPTTGTAVYGTGTYIGMFGKGEQAGLQGVATGTQLGNGYPSGVYGTGVLGVQGSGTISGVLGYSNSVSGFFGALGFGQLAATSQVGVVGNAGDALSLSDLNAGTKIGVYGRAAGGTTVNYAGFFQGNVHVQGTLTASNKLFKIDHPLDPEHKFLYHACVESPEMKNIYDGVVTLDQQGQVTVELPAWFEALNTDYRYQLTCLGQYAPVFIAEEIKEKKFKIAGGKPGQKVSWLVTGVRQDEWAKANRISVELDKTGDEKGKYLHPEAFGKSEELRFM